jgi:hypothetical protein
MDLISAVLFGGRSLFGGEGFYERACDRDRIGYFVLVWGGMFG